MKLKREILRFCVILSMFLVQFHFQKSWWHKKVNCLPYDFRKWDLPTLHVAEPFVKKITKFNDACRHNDVIKWKHFLRHWPFVRWIHWSPVNSPQKDHWCGALMFSLICAWIDGWVNTHEAGDVIRSRAHYDVTVMVPVPASHPGYYPGTLSCS